MLETSQYEVRGSNLAPKTTLLKVRSRVGAMADSDMKDTLSAPLYYLTQIRPPEGHGTQHIEGLMVVDMREEAVQKRYVPTPWWTGAMVMGTWRMGYPMAMGMQRMRIRPMVVGTRCSGDNMDTKATYSYQWKMTKTQRTRIRLMVAGAQGMDSGLKAKVNPYIREAW